MKRFNGSRNSQRTAQAQPAQRRAPITIDHHTPAAATKSRKPQREERKPQREERATNAADRGDPFVQIGDKTRVYVSVDEYNGAELLNIRRYAVIEGEYRPTSAGISLVLEKAPEVLSLALDAMRNSRLATGEGEEESIEYMASDELDATPELPENFWFFGGDSREALQNRDAAAARKATGVPDILYSEEETALDEFGAKGRLLFAGRVLDSGVAACKPTHRWNARDERWVELGDFSSIKIALGEFTVKN